MTSGAMSRPAAKELLHIRGWLDRVGDIVDRGKPAYLEDDLLQEADWKSTRLNSSHPG